MQSGKTPDFTFQFHTWATTVTCMCAFIHTPTNKQTCIQEVTWTTCACPPPNDNGCTLHFSCFPWVFCTCPKLHVDRGQGKVLNLWCLGPWSTLERKCRTLGIIKWDLHFSVSMFYINKKFHKTITKDYKLFKVEFFGNLGNNLISQDVISCVWNGIRSYFIGLYRVRHL